MASYIIQLKVMKPTMMDILLLTTLKKKTNRSFCYQKTNNTSRNMGGRPPGLGNDVKGHQWKEGKGGGRRGRGGRGGTI